MKDLQVVLIGIVFTIISKNVNVNVKINVNFVKEVQITLELQGENSREKNELRINK